MEKYSATFSPQKNNSNRYCCVPQCNSKACRDITVRFHQFPRNGELVLVENNWGSADKCDRRKVWIHRLRIGKNVSNTMFVCSKHFQRSDYILPDISSKRRCLKKTAVPSLNLPKSTTDDLLCERRKRKRELNSMLRRNWQLLSELDNEGMGEPADVVPVTDGEGTCLIDPEREAAEGLLSLGSYLPPPQRQSISIQAKAETRDFGCQVSTGDFKVSFVDNIESPKNLATFTSIDTFLKLSCIVNIFALLNPNNTRFTFSIKEQIIMTMMKLKLNWSFTVLGVVFGCSGTTCKNVISRTVPILGSILKSVLVWPSKQEIIRDMPKCFSNFKGVRIILDCTEVRLSTLRCLKCRILSYSQYKGSNTIKYMIGVTPGGLISFVSHGYGGRASDKKIFEESDLLGLMEPGVDEIMVDKGFLIHSICQEKGINVIHPPFLRRKKQFSKEEAEVTLEVARARAHVERAIERLKKFKFLSERIPHTLAHLVDTIMVILCAVTNLSRPIMAEDKFM